MVTFTGKLTNIYGAVINVSGSPSIAAAPQTVFGVTPDTSNGMTSLTPDLTVFPHNRFARVYGATTCPQWTDATTKALAIPGTVLAFSAKYQSIAEYKTNMDNIPLWATEVFYTWFHERNRPLAKYPPTLAQCQSMDAQLIALRNGHPNRAKIRIVPCFSWYPAAVGHNEGTPWAQFMVDPNGKPFAFDGIAWDQYCEDSTKPDDPATFVTLPVSSATKWQLPLSIWETGIGSGGGDTSAAAWLQNVAKEYVLNGVRYVAYWNSGSYKLNTRPAPLAAWKSLL